MPETAVAAEGDREGARRPGKRKGKDADSGPHPRQAPFAFALRLSIEASNHPPAKDATPLPNPVYLGGRRALVDLPSGDWICVDTNSIDATDYLLGFGIEQHVFPVFRRLLRHDSVVVDVGANFGFYTVSAGTVMGRHGQLWAFEANPRTFDLLRRSAYANQLFHNPRVRLVNALVGEAKGRGTLYVPEEFLGGASRNAAAGRGPGGTAVELDMVALDDVLPPDLAVDLVKIDVEGYEPFVLKGMERALARSPNCRVILECFEGMLENSFGVANFQRYVADLGFTLCVVEADTSLRPVPPAERLRGDNYCVLTRTPEADGAQRHFALRPPEFTLPGGDGAATLVEGAAIAWRAGPGKRRGHRLVFHGPYYNFAPGFYRVRLEGAVEGAMLLRAQAEFGRWTIAEHAVDRLPFEFVLDLPRAARRFELAGFATEATEGLTLREVQVTPL